MPGFGFIDGIVVEVEGFPEHVIPLIKNKEEDSDILSKSDYITHGVLLAIICFWLPLTVYTLIFKPWKHRASFAGDRKSVV